MTAARSRAPFFLRYLVHSTRGARGRLAFFTLCLALGIAAVVAVAALGDSLGTNLRREAKQLLGGDLAVSGRRPVPPEAVTAVAAAAPGARGVRLVELETMAAAAPRGAALGAAGEPPASLLVELKVVGEGYPLYGAIATRPDRPLVELLAGGLVVAPELLARLGLEVGDGLKIGSAVLPIRAVITGEPDRALSPFSLGPRVLMRAEDFPATGLDTFGSRLERRVTWRLPGNPGGEEVERVAQALRTALPAAGSWRVTTYVEAQQGLAQGLARVERFLGLVALLSLLVGGVGVAQSVRAFLASRLDAVALLRCLGVRPREAFALFLVQALLLGLAGSLLGGLAGLVVQSRLPSLFDGLVAVDALPFWQPRALARGLALGLATTLLFSLPPLSLVLRVPPLRALRRDAEPLRLSPLVQSAIAALLVAGVALLAATQARSPLVGAIFAVGLAGVLAVLAGAAVGLRRLCGALRHGPLPLVLRQAAARLARPAGDSLAALLALGVGVLVVLTTVLVERHLRDALAAQLPAEAPSAFLLDVQPDQWREISRLLGELGAANVDSVPVVMARLAAIDDRRAEDLAQGEAGDRHWALTREQRLTYLAELPPDNELVAGSLWQRPDVAEVSLEEEFARELGVGLGSRLAFDVQGVPIELVVTSLRRVDWRTFRINFFLVVEPGVLEEAPQTRLAAAALPPGGEQRAQDVLVARFPNVTLVDVRAVLERVSRLLARLAAGVRFLGAFTALAGLGILAGAVAAGGVRRGREAALLKTLGFTRRGVAAVFAAEHALTGLVAGAVGCLAASGITWALVTYDFELAWRPLPLVLLAAAAVAVGLALVAGLAASAPAIARPPAEVLRGERD